MPTTEGDPTKARFLKSYEIRNSYKDEIQRPPAVSGVQGTIDIHCHADAGHQDPVALAKYGATNGMGGILFKSIAGDDGPAQAVRRVQDELSRWSDGEKVEPMKCWAGYNIARTLKPPSVEATRKQLDEGITAVWMPVFMSANTMHKVGVRKGLVDPAADRPNEKTPPLPFEEAVKIGHYLLDEHGKLKSEIHDIVHLVMDRGAALFFGHPSHPELFALAEEVDKLGFKRAVVDHPFSPFIDLTFEEMKQVANSGIYLNFTFDELSPLLGVEPFRMYQAIRHIGVEQVTLSSDAGLPLFPNSVECMRLMCTYMKAFGLSQEEVQRISVVNPSAVVGVN